MGWITSNWPGFWPNSTGDRTWGAAGRQDADEILNRAIAWPHREPLIIHPLLGGLPLAHTAPQGSRTSCAAPSAGCRGPRPRSAFREHIPCPSAATAVSATPIFRRRVGPRTTIWTSRQITGRASPIRNGMRGRRASCPITSRCSSARILPHPRAGAASADLRKWFEERTHRAMKNRLEDGSDLDVDRYISHYIDLRTGEAIEPRIFSDLLPSTRDVTTALLLDGSSSLGVHGGRSSSSSWPARMRFPGRWHSHASATASSSSPAIHGTGSR